MVQLHWAPLEKAEVPVLFKPWRRQRENAARQIIYHPAKAFSIFKRTEQFYIISGASLQQISLDIYSRTPAGLKALPAPSLRLLGAGTTFCLLVLKLQTWEGQVARGWLCGRGRRRHQPGGKNMAFQVTWCWMENQQAGPRAARVETRGRLAGFQRWNNEVWLHLAGRPLGEAENGHRF